MRTGPVGATAAGEPVCAGCAHLRGPDCAEQESQAGDLKVAARRMHTEQEIGIMASSGAASYSGHVNLGLWIDSGNSGNGFGSKAELRAVVPMRRRALA